MPSPACVRVRALLVATLVVLGLVLEGCSSPAKPSASKDRHDSAHPSASASATAPAADPGYGAPTVGQCSTLTGQQSLASVAAPSTTVRCSRPHTTVVAFVGYSRRPVTPATPVAARRALGQKLCAPAYRAYVGGTVDDRAMSLLTWTLFTPSQAQLKRGARWVRCDVLARSGGALVPLPSGKPLLKSSIPEALRVCQDVHGADVSCRAPHVYRVEAVFRGLDARYPGANAYVARGRCHTLMGGYGGYVQFPSRPGWAHGDRFIRCLGPLPPGSTS